MSNKRQRKGGRQARRISVRAVRRESPDLPKLSRAIVALALAQAEAEAQAEGGPVAEPGTTTTASHSGSTPDER